MWLSTDFLRHVVGETDGRAAITVARAREHCRLSAVEDFLCKVSTNHGERRKNNSVSGWWCGACGEPKIAEHRDRCAFPSWGGPHGKPHRCALSCGRGQSRWGGWNPDGSGSKQLDFVCSMVHRTKERHWKRLLAKKLMYKVSWLLLRLVAKVSRNKTSNVVKWTSDEPSVLGSTRLKIESEEGSLVQPRGSEQNRNKKPQLPHWLLFTWEWFCRISRLWSKNVPLEYQRQISPTFPSGFVMQVYGCALCFPASCGRRTGLGGPASNLERCENCSWTRSYKGCGE